jgi:flavin reductase (DIM6/NTAB) family NADH-FMN oxidoreductase RutF
VSTPVLSPLQARFRDVMGSVCTPVSVVTTIADGLPYGSTVSAFSSLSLDPPMVLVALNNGSTLLSAVRRTHRFGVNVLADAQTALAITFAGKGGPAKFTRIDWTAESAVPRLPAPAGFLVCDLAGQVPGGDHTILLGSVRSADEGRTGEGRAAPLTYHARTFGTHAAHGTLTTAPARPR